MTSSSPSFARPQGQTADERILVLDFGSQYAQLIARRVREQNVYCEIVRHDISAERLAELSPRGVILSGGPNSVYEDGAPKCDPKIFTSGFPILGICYGMQLMCDAMGAHVDSAPARESVAILRLPMVRLLHVSPSRLHACPPHGTEASQRWWPLL